MADSMVGEVPEASPLDWAVASRDAQVKTMVREALRDQRAVLAFQPVRQARGGMLAFHEGLIRVLDETGRIIPAQDFMGEIESDGLGRDIDAAALRLGFQHLRARPDLRVSINVSARSLGDSLWRDALNEGLRMGEDVTARMILEISEESAMLLPEVVIRFMEEMQPRGISFALDDFGAGFTAFRYLKDFFFDLVKIDDIFVRGIEDQPDNQVLAEALLAVAHQFDMFAVAEGVETEAEAEFLRSIGCDCLQGYHIGVPRLKV